ncbi:hypothetical protein R1flu_028402 [Riccia fluitans]|uniref:TLC domain-containing protein n=1 Tax=Riccia fluitans TaxID=41844 RepID=A0ABD1XLL1_9MARC
MTRWRDAMLDWEHESYPEQKDFSLIPLFAIFFFTVRFLLDGYVFEAAGRYFVFGKGGCKLKGASEAEKDALRKTVVKFKESSWKLCYFLSAEIFALTATHDEAWFMDTMKFWVGPGDQIWPDQLCKSKLKLLYMSAAGFYTYSIFALVFWETRRKDFGVSMSHHVVTLALIIVSYWVRLGRVGSVVLALHDASDVFLEVAKLTKYSGSELIPAVAFVVFALSWIALRLVFLPFWVIRSTSYEVLSVADRHHPYAPLKYYVCNTLLISLFVLHIYWWVLIWRTLLRQIKALGKVDKDVRSDSEDEDLKEE